MRTLITLLRSQIVNRKLSNSKYHYGCKQCKVANAQGHACYASDIIQKLKEARLIVVEGTLYPLLTRLKNDDLLGYEWIESTQGPPRKYYRLTEKGEVFLGELEMSWKELNETVNHISNS